MVNFGVVCETNFHISKMCVVPKENNLLKFNQTKHLPFPKPQNNITFRHQPEDPGPLSQSSNPKTDAAEAPDATELATYAASSGMYSYN